MTSGADYHTLIGGEDGADDLLADVNNGHEDDDDFERILMADVAAPPASSVTSRFTKSDKDAMIQMIFSQGSAAGKTDVVTDDDGVAEDDDDRPLVEDSITFLQPSRATAGDGKRLKGSRSKERRIHRKKHQMNQCLLPGDDDEEDEEDEPADLNLPPPTGREEGSLSEESSLVICIQVFIPFLVAGFGTVGAGLVLDYVQHWDVFRKVSEVFILVPALLGLKGNLEMTLASRLSTAANLGVMSDARTQWNLAVANVALVQAQAAVVALLAAMFAILMDWLPEGEFNPRHAVLLVASSLLTASVASFLLAILMIVVVILSHRLSINPDNVATPIAASLGDLTTLTLLANFASILFYTTDHSLWLCVTLITVLLALVPVWIMIAHSNPCTRDVLYYGWTPVISAMAISSAGGMILDFAVSRFKGIAVFQPVINGVGGNLVAVQASRISTYLHQRSHPGLLPKDSADLCASPLNTFCGPHVHAKTARVLLFIAIPGHLIFTFGIQLIQAGHTSITPTFLLVYLSAAMTQILVLLFLARSLILFMWTRKIDPDNSAIPYLTAVGDLLGTGLLAIAFYVMFRVGDQDADVGD